MSKNNRPNVCFIKTQLKETLKETQKETIRTEGNTTELNNRTRRLGQGATSKEDYVKE